MVEKKNPGQVSAYLDAWTLAQIQKIALEEDRSVSWLIAFAAKKFCVDRGGVTVLLEPPAKKARQVDIEEQIAASKKKTAKHK